ncbi:MAG: transporter [Dehalococcoidia bacterium]
MVGIGETTYSRKSGMTDLTLQLTAAMRAIEDAGIKPTDIDGILPQAAGATSEDFATNLGVKDLRFSAQINMGGASPCAAIQNGVLAVASGVCNYVLLVSGRNGYSGARTAQSIGAGLGGGPMRTMGEFEYIYGLVAPMLWYGPMAKRHMHLYGTTSLQFAEVSVAMRKHASMQSNAQMKELITIEDHQNSPMLADPFRLLDCCLQTDGAAACVITTPERAKDLKKPPVYISGFGEAHPDSPSSITQRPDMTTFGIAKLAPRVFEMAGITPKDIDVAELYDCFTFTVINQIEDIGFCGKGEGGGFVEGGRIQIGGDLPVNTHGGLLSQGHIMGMNHVVEGIKQVRGTSDVQVKDAEVALVSGYGDFGDGALAIFSRR